MRFLRSIVLAFSLVFFLAPAQAEPSTAVSFPSYQDNAQDRSFLKELREKVALGKEIPKGVWPNAEDFAKTSFPKENFGLAVVLHQPGSKRIRSIATRMKDLENLRRSVNGIVLSPRFSSFKAADPERCRIQIDFITDAPAAVKFESLSQASTGPDRFDMGVDGLLAVHNKDRFFFMPGDAFIKSYLALAQIAKDVNAHFKGVPREELKFFRFTTRSFVSYKDSWIPLYRGYPVLWPPESFDAVKVRAVVDSSVDYLIRHQKEDGRFLYYYEAATDSYRDHEHPERDPNKNPYFNELRHTAGTILLLRQYKRTKDPKLLESARGAIDWTLSHMVYRTPAGGRPSAYLYYNRKSKLGGSGILLYVLSYYQHVSNDGRYAETAAMVKNHLISQVTASGEFIYYNIYLDKPITEAENQNYFSFYYPGEAVCGLAAYYKYVEGDKKEKALIRQKLRLAMNFLMQERPKVYAQYFSPLPSDSWLMLGILEMWDEKELQKGSYKNFVFGDADKMVERMYKREDALYPDYVGAYYYNYGDFPYADGARDEGLEAAYELAIKVGDKERSAKYFEALKLAGWAALHLVNTPESVYAVPNPALAIGGIRFKHTRQWFRVDTIVHVAAYYIQLLPFLEAEETKQI